MAQMTVKRLYQELAIAIKLGHGDKFIIVADDNEGNGYHGMFYGITADPDLVKLADGDIYDSVETNTDNLVILG